MKPGNSRRHGGSRGAAAGADDDLDRGRAAYERRAWRDAFESLSRADRAGPLGVEDLERLGWSAALTGRDAEHLAARERLHRLHLEAGQNLRAARAAFWLGFRLFSLGEMGRAGAWLARAQGLVEREGRDCVERGYLLLPAAHRHLAAGEAESAVAVARAAAEIADRFGDENLASFARSIQGRALIQLDRHESGLAILDEAMLAATRGALSPLITGLVYCSVIDCCQRVYAVGRAREWTAALAEWCESQPQLVTFTGTCRVHRSEILQLQGAWDAAIEEARRASERFSKSAAGESAAAALYQQAEIHRLRGEHAAAEEAYRGSSRFGREPQPGLALLRLAQGRGAVAAAAIRRAVEAAKAPLERTRHLPAAVEILLAVGDLDGARGAAGELEEIAARTSNPILVAMAAHARGAIRLAEGDPQGAIEPLRRSFETWRDADAPYLAARVRVLIGSAYRTLGDAEGAELELDAARAVFRDLGAVPDLDRLTARAGEGRPARPFGLSPRELEVLRLVASGKTNKAISRELFLSEKTIDRHVSNIFNKLDVPSRAAATAFAYRHQLL